MLFKFAYMGLEHFSLSIVTTNYSNNYFCPSFSPLTILLLQTPKLKIYDRKQEDGSDILKNFVIKYPSV